MIDDFNLWELLAGLSLFLFAMSQLEAGLQAFAGKSLARFLKEQTSSRFNALLGGLVGTALLQSSSILGLMVLAFVGAGLLTLSAALGIIFGSNLGSTFTGWIVATIGFKVELQAFALPLVAVGGFAYMFGKGRWSEAGKVLLAFGLLLLGLELMKSAVASIEQLIDTEMLDGLQPWQYLLFGLVVAAIVQSSAVTLMIALAALDAGIITLPNAAAVAIGADLGTTTTIMLGAVRGSAIKRQVAAGHVVFNLVTDLVAFALRLPLLALIAAVGIEDPLYSLVAFHSLFNLIGLFIFIPLTSQFAHWLARLFREEETHVATYLIEAGSGSGEAGLQATESETALLIVRVMRLIARAFDPPLDIPAGKFPVPWDDSRQMHVGAGFNETYRTIKNLEGEILEFTIGLQTGALPPAASVRLGMLLNAVREATHAAKSIKDIAHNLADFRDSGDPADDAYRQVFRADVTMLFADLFDLRERDDTVDFDDLVEVLGRLEHRHDKVHQQIYRDVRNGRVRDTGVSSVLNVNREILVAGRALINALAYYHLPEQQAVDIARMPRAA